MHQPGFSNGRQNQVRVFDEAHDVRIRFERADVFDFIQKNKEPADLLIAHAFLDLLPMPESLPKLLSLTKDLAWLTINFDGVTTFEPTIDVGLIHFKVKLPPATHLRLELEVERHTQAPSYRGPDL